MFPDVALQWATYISGATNLTQDEIGHMNGNELSILQYATEERNKQNKYTQAAAIALAFGGKE